MGIEALLETMSKLQDAHTALLELAEAKTPVLVRNDVDELNVIVNKENKLMRIIAELDQQRVQVIGEYLLARGYNPNPRITVSDLIKVIFKSEEKLAITEAQKSLAVLLKQLKELNEINQKLIEQSIAFIDYSLDVIVGGPEDEVVYQNPQQHVSGMNRPGLFDAKA